MPDDMIHGWKAIADVLGRTTMTAYRWYHKRGLPVYFGPSGQVFAFRSKLLEFVLRSAKENEEKRQKSKML